MAKKFAWSFSKLKNYETCPKRHYEIDIAKTAVEKVDPDGPLAYGNAVHKALALALTEGTPLAPDMPFQHWVDRVKAGPGRLLVEQKYAITRDYSKSAFFSPAVWYRGIADVVRIAGAVGLTLDWKTGKPKPDSVQLALMAQCLFSNFPELKRVRAEFVWLQDDTTTCEVYARADMADLWEMLLPRVEKMETAANTLTYPPTPSGLCVEYCPVVSCPYHGKGTRRG